MPPFSKIFGSVGSYTRWGLRVTLRIRGLGGISSFGTGVPGGEGRYATERFLLSFSEAEGRSRGALSFRIANIPIARTVIPAIVVRVLPRARVELLLVNPLKFEIILNI